MIRKLVFTTIAGLMIGAPLLSFGQEAAAEVGVDAGAAFVIDNLFLFIAAVLVFFMQAGFAMLESGLNQSKTVVNILTKNLMDLCFGVLLYFIVGYGLMYPGEFNGYFGFAGLFVGDGTPGVMSAAVEAGALTTQVDFLFQAAFAATAATIVSGAVAGRLKFVGYIVFTVIITGFVYPVSGSWKWGGGFLDAMGFYDFAGSCVVHAVGGFAGLAGAIVLGPRLGRFSHGKNTPIPGHNLTAAALGVFILWIGWFGFNPGSQLAISSAGDVGAVMLIAVNTSLAAAAGGVVALIISWIVGKKPEFTMALNGTLAGLVGITANCDGVSNMSAIIIGAVAGLLVFGGTKLLETLKIDDPVGAWPVHGLCGMWGCIAAGIFGVKSYWGEAAEGVMYGNMMAQVVGTLVICAWAFGTMFGVFFLLKLLGLLRVSEEEELQGLDLSEHGQEAYGASDPVSA